MSEMSLNQILQRARIVHEWYREHEKSWNQFEQNAHVHREVSEVWEVLRNKDSKFGVTFSEEWEKNLLDEISDVVISAYTHALDLKIPQNKIIESMNRTLCKIENRSVYQPTLSNLIEDNKKTIEADGQ